MKKTYSIKKTVIYVSLIAALCALFSAFTFAAGVSAPKVNGIKITAKTTTSVTLEWTVKGKASGYRIYRYYPETKKYKQLKNQKGRKCTVKSLTPGDYYVFAVRPYVKGAKKTMNGSYKKKTAYTPLGQITKITQKTTEPTSHRLSWTKVRGADYYEIWYYKNGEGRFVRLSGGSANNSCNMTKLNPASVYKYKIRAVSVTSNGKFIYSKLSKAFTAITSVPGVQGLKAVNVSTSGYKLTWSAIPNAQAYYLYRFDSNTGEYDLITACNKPEYTVSGKESAQQDSYCVKAYAVVNGKKMYGDMSDAFDVSTKPESVGLYKGEGDLPGNKKVVLEWDECEKADGYFIYMSKDPDSGFTLKKEITNSQTLSAVIERLENRTPYYFRIKSYVIVNDGYVLSDSSNTIRTFA